MNCTILITFIVVHVLYYVVYAYGLNYMTLCEDIPALKITLKTSTFNLDLSLDKSGTR